MPLKVPNLAPKPHRPRTFGRKGAEGMKKVITRNSRANVPGLSPLASKSKSLRQIGEPHYG
jgi:hypothetical protein